MEAEAEARMRRQMVEAAEKALIKRKLDAALAASPQLKVPGCMGSWGL